MVVFGSRNYFGSLDSEGACGSMDCAFEIGVSLVLVFVLFNGGIAFWRCGKPSFCVFSILRLCHQKIGFL